MRRLKKEQGIIMSSRSFDLPQQGYLSRASALYGTRFGLKRGKKKKEPPDPQVTKSASAE